MVHGRVIVDDTLLESSMGISGLGEEDVGGWEG